MNTIKFGYMPDLELCFSAFQESGEGRGVPLQELDEVRPTGLYLGQPITDIQFGDVALVYEQCRLTYEGADVVTTDYDFVYYEGMQCFYEDKWLIDKDSTSSDYPVFVVYNPIGEGEMEIEAVAWNSLVDVVNTLLTWRASTQQNFGTSSVQPMAISAPELLGLPQKVKLYR